MCKFNVEIKIIEVSFVNIIGNQIASNAMLMKCEIWSQKSWNKMDYDV